MRVQLIYFSLLHQTGWTITLVEHRISLMTYVIAKIRCNSIMKLDSLFIWTCHKCVLHVRILSHLLLPSLLTHHLSLLADWLLTASVQQWESSSCLLSPCSPPVPASCPSWPPFPLPLAIPGLLAHWGLPREDREASVLARYRWEAWPEVGERG